MDLAQKTLADNQVQVNVGTMAPIDLVQAESDVANRKVQLVTSTYTQAQTQDQVKKLITSQSDPGMLLATLMPLQPVHTPSPSDVPSIEEAIRIALENRPEMRQAELTLKNKDLDVEYTKHQMLPTVDFLGSYTQNGLGGVETLRDFSQDFGPGAPIIFTQPGGVGDAFGQLFGFGYTGYAGAINVQIPLSNRAAVGDNARAGMDRHIAEKQISATAQQIALDVRNAMTQIEMNRAQIEAAQKARELAELKLQAEQKKFDLGASTIRFVLEEQRNVAQAQTDEIAALVNYTKALADFDHAAGLTLKKNGIQIDKTMNPTTSSN
jgi:outer membrane protein TolC